MIIMRLNKTKCSIAELIFAGRKDELTTNMFYYLFIDKTNIN